jgi:hypothetical protein
MFRCYFFIKLLAISLLFVNSAYSQSDTSFLSRATGLLEKQPVTEKVYLHLDKPNYNFGDTIWYKAYTVIGQHHQLSGLSGVLYVELISPKDSLVTMQILPLVSGVGWSDIPLAHSLKQGIYLIRAYTNYMRNDAPDYFFNQKIRVGGIAPSNPAQQTAVQNPDVQFFPEGGQLVNGVRSRVAVKAIGGNGIGADIKGEIEDNAGNVVTEFATQHLGMGVFALTPESGKTYKAKINGPGEISFTVDLPKAQEEGFVLSLNNSQPDSIFIKVAINEKTLNEQKNAPFYIIGQSNSKIYYTSKGKLDGLVYVAKTDKARFPSGIAQFTLFNQNGEPMAERIAFIQNADTLKLNIAGTAPAYTTRQAVKINLEAKDYSNQPVTGSFSVTVINESETGIDINNESTIINNLLLTSDLKGYIEQPNYYFNNADDKTRADLDVLMLTQGYRRFEWKKILKDTVRAISFAPETSLSLTGTLKTPSGKTLPNGKVTLMATKQNLLKDTATDAEGEFKFSGLYFTDTITMIIRARKENKGSNVKIEIEPVNYPALIKTNKADTAIAGQPPSLLTLMQKKYKDYQEDQKQSLTKNGITLKQVQIKGYRKPPPPDLSGSANLHGGGNADQVIMGDNLGVCVHVSDCLIGKIHGVVFSQNGEPLNTRGMGKMSIIVDGTIMSGINLNEVNADDIYSIEVLRSTFARSIYGSSIEGGGALVITMKHGANNNINVIPSGLATYTFNGFYKARAFYIPKYTGPLTAKQTPDLRNTIYWYPNIITGKDGKATFEYFNNDTKGTYRVVVEGIDDNGNLGRLVYRYKVD